MFHDFNKGWLPFRGTISEQPIKIRQIFDIIETHKNVVQGERNKLLEKLSGDGTNNV
jgi:hypothetical protein